MRYNEAIRGKMNSLKSGGFLLLAIETSCDETSAAVLNSPTGVLSNVIHTQIPIHREFGGVVPEIASRSHVERIGGVVREALSSAGVTIEDINAIAVTSHPGLIGALLVGISYAKGLALGLKIPITGVNHIHGHIAANYISHPDIKPPYVCLVASGGHSNIVIVRDYCEYEELGRTVDDAAGEAFDKVARVMGLPYPGGPQLERLASTGESGKYRFHSAFNESPSYDFSFSGLKTAVINLIHSKKQRGETINLADVAASFQETVVNVLVNKTVAAANRHGLKSIAIAGGVSANMALREQMKKAAHAGGMEFYCPDMRYCSDNAAMIGAAGYRQLIKNVSDGLDLNGTATK